MSENVQVLREGCPNQYIRRNELMPLKGLSLPFPLSVRTIQLFNEESSINAVVSVFRASSSSTSFDVR